MKMLANMPEWRRISDPYFWLTALIIAKNGVVREYQNSFLGIVWTVVLPLIQVMIFAIIMPMIMARPVDNYALFLVASFPLWSFISGSLVQSSHAILHQAETIKRCMVSSVIFPISDIMKNFYTYLVSFFTMYAFCVVFYVPFDPVIFLVLPLLLIPIFISVMSLSIAIAYIAPYIRDIGYFMHMVVNVMFWFTPIVYPLNNVPEQYHWLYWINPFYLMIHPAQQLVFQHQLPDMQDLAGLLIVMVGSILVSFIVYRICRRNYVYYL